MNSQEGDDGDRDDDPGYRRRSDIQQYEMVAGLTSLHFLGEDMFMTMQAHNLALVDEFIMDLEQETLSEWHKTERTPGVAFFLSAQSQMWIFAAYELLRTCRQRLREAIQLQQGGGLQDRIAALRADHGYRHYGQEMKADQLEELSKNPKLMTRLEEDMRQLFFPFTNLEHIRLTLAKHEAPKKFGKANVAAYSPGYGRINMDCGALDYELEADGVIFGKVNRRDIADSLRGLLDRTKVPTDSDISDYKAMLANLPKAGFNPFQSPKK